MVIPLEGSVDQAAEAGPVRTCRGCGCTDDHACLNASGVPCHWVKGAGDLCSACEPDDPLLDGLFA